MEKTRPVKLGSVWSTETQTSHGIVVKKMGFLQKTARNLYNVIFGASAPESSFMAIFICLTIGLELLIPAFLAA
nr:MAG TPA: hypothetical protein [Caudoviricetes sp.]